VYNTFEIELGFQRVIKVSLRISFDYFLFLAEIHRENQSSRVTGKVSAREWQ
jgi:hypothetical protein